MTSCFSMCSQPNTKHPSRMLPLTQPYKPNLSFDSIAFTVLKVFNPSISPHFGLIQSLITLHLGNYNTLSTRLLTSNLASVYLQITTCDLSQVQIWLCHFLLKFYRFPLHLLDRPKSPFVFLHKMVWKTWMNFFFLSKCMNLWRNAWYQICPHYFMFLLLYFPK